MTGNGSELKGTLRVWIDQDLCTGDGLCEEILPAVFGARSDGNYGVKENGVLLEPGGSDSLANVPEGMESLAGEAADECPGECIFFADAQGNPVTTETVLEL